MISQYKQQKLINDYLYNKCTKEDFEDWYIYSSEDTLADELKYTIHKSLSTIEKTIILLYINIGYERLAKELGVSVGTAYKKVKQIKEKIKQYANT